MARLARIVLSDLPHHVLQRGKIEGVPNSTAQDQGCRDDQGFRGPTT